MTNKEFVNKLTAIANDKTTYGLGGYGQYATTANKLMFKTMYSKNRSGVIKEGLDSADSTTRIYNCNGLVKSTINGNKGYTKSPCPDINIEAMLNNCTAVSSDMNNIEVGEYLVYKDKSHCGIYAGIINGKRIAIECTYRWNNGVQFIEIDREERKDMWGYHGKLSKWISYPQPSVAVMSKDQHELLKCANDLLYTKEGYENDFVKAIQRVLLYDYGYKAVSPVGYFGTDTKNALMDFQSKHKIEATGIVDLDTVNALIGK